MAEISPSPTVRPAVLIVDDLAANLGVLQGLLEEAGYRVLVATSGERALTRLAYMQPDLILLDVNMAGMDGYETCRRIKADARWCDVPVLFLTALDDPADKLHGFDAGAVDYITKPLQAEEVLARVRTHLKICSLQRALAEKNVLLENALARRLEAETQLQQSLDRAVLVVAADGEIEFCTHLARGLLKQHFPGHADTATLPPPLAHWLASGPPTGPWVVDDTPGALEVRRYGSSDPGDLSVLLLHEKVVGETTPARLLQLGLTTSEADVLYWAAHGKSNQEVALILGKTLNTIKKHMANLIVKMGVDTRLVAALQAAEILEVKAVEPERLRTLREGRPPDNSVD